MDELCTTCLCAGRDLQYLENTEYYHLYLQIMNENHDQAGVRVCWECCAVLRSVQRFRRQVRRCQMLLSEQGTPNYQLCQPPRLSAQLVDYISYPPLEVKTEPTDTIDATEPTDVADDVTVEFMYNVKVEPDDKVEHSEPDMFVYDLEMDECEEQDQKKATTSAQPGTSRKRKATRAVHITYEQQILQRLGEDEEQEFSDVDDDVDDKDFVIEEVHEESEISGEEVLKGEVKDPRLTNETHGREIKREQAQTKDPDLRSTSERRETQSESQTSDRDFYCSKSGFVWSKTDFSKTPRTPAHNINSLPTRDDQMRFPGYEKLWDYFFDDEMIESLVLCTNKKLEAYRQLFSNDAKQELKYTTRVEIRSLLGLLYYSSVFCNNADSNYLFATDGTGHEIFRCVMSKYRFSTLLSCMRLDNVHDRQERLKTDPLAAVSSFFNKFIANCQSHYTLGPYACIDEMLLAFKGRCKFIVYMPNKPAKFGIKIMVLTDAQQFYVYNAYIYHGKGSHGVGLPESEQKMAVPTQSVLRLVKPIENSRRNITADNWFSSIPLAEMLLKIGLTYLGPLQKDKGEIPPEFKPNKRRPVESSLYGFTEDLTLMSYVPQKDKAVVLLSTCHKSASVDENSGKPTMIIDYNQTKGGVVEVDKKCAVYSCSRKTRRWPQAVFYRLLDIAGINAFVLYGRCRGAKLRRGDFVLHLARELVLPALKQRVYNEKLPRELRMTLRRVLGHDLPPPPPVPEPESSARKVCRVCPSKLKRRTRFVCCVCAKPICLQCAAQICEDCKSEV